MLPKKVANKISEIMKKHEAGSLPKSCYADDGHIYMNELLRNGNPNNAMLRSKSKEERDKRKMEEADRKLKERAEYFKRHPELKNKEMLKIQK